MSGKDDVDSAAPEPPSKKIVKTLTPPTSGLGTGYTFFIEECHRSGEEVICSGRVTNITDATAMFYAPYPSRAVDDERNSIPFNGVRFTDGGSQERLMINVPVGFTITVHDSHRNATKLNLDLPVDFDDSKQSDHLTFEDIPIQ